MIITDFITAWRIPPVQVSEVGQAGLASLVCQAVLLKGRGTLVWVSDPCPVLFYQLLKV